jgi:hypothetical protein
MTKLPNDDTTCVLCGQVFNKYGFHSCGYFPPFGSETKEELIAEYEREILPQKIKEALDKFHKQWQHALSKSKSKQKAIKYCNEVWIAWVEEHKILVDGEFLSNIIITPIEWKERKDEVSKQ